MITRAAVDHLIVIEIHIIDRRQRKHVTIHADEVVTDHIVVHVGVVGAIADPHNVTRKHDTIAPMQVVGHHINRIILEVENDLFRHHVNTSITSHQSDHLGTDYVLPRFPPTQIIRVSSI